MTTNETAYKALIAFKQKHSIEPNVVFMGWPTYWNLVDEIGSIEVEMFSGMHIGINPSMDMDVFEFRKEG